jgi:8-oxo-dGTP pyrophosphatase MutT (NUDIX family)
VVVPKGWPVKSCTPQQTVAVEAYEEAGVRGVVGAKHVGRFRKRGLRRSGRCFAMSEFFHSKSRFNKLIGLKSNKAASGFRIARRQNW